MQMVIRYLSEPKNILLFDIAYIMIMLHYSNIINECLFICIILLLHIYYYFISFEVEKYST